ncbi:MAG: hypothetical protein ACFFCW_33995 [Candidatus Hodarchaeota archaeon]
MALTDNCDLYGSIDEKGINNLIQHIMRQRPSLFNYGTALLASKPELFCERIVADPEVQRKGNPMFTIEAPLPVLGTNGAVALNFCFQITRVNIDFHPGNIVTLPPELGPPLRPQSFAFYTRVCGGLGCSREIAEEIPPPPPPPADKKAEVPLPPPVIPVPKELICFCLDLIVVGHAEVAGSAGNQRLLGKVDGLEIVDVRPEELESSLECYLNLLLQLVILPRTSIALGKVAFDILNLATISLSPTPTSSTIPFNPAIEKDQLKMFIDVGVAP